MPSHPPDAAAGQRHASDSPRGRRAALSRTELAAIAVPWITALFLPAIRIVGGPPVRGLELLEHGWRAAESGVLAWCANPLFGVAMLLAAVGAYAAAGCVSGVGLVLALTSFAAPQVARASGAAVPELYFEPGFYLWLLACLALPAWCWSALWRRRR
jgi:hypothetical protein